MRRRTRLRPGRLPVGGGRKVRLRCCNWFRRLRIRWEGRAGIRQGSGRICPKTAARRPAASAMLAAVMYTVRRLVESTRMPPSAESAACSAPTTGSPARSSSPTWTQQRSLIPVDVLVCELAVPEAGHYAYRQPDLPPGGRHAGKQVVHGDVVGEGHHQLVDHLAGADGPGDPLHRGIRRPAADEDLLVEPAYLVPADPSGHDRDVTSRAFTRSPLRARRAGRVASRTVGPILDPGVPAPRWPAPGRRVQGPQAGADQRPAGTEGEAGAAGPVTSGRLWL